MQVSVIIAAYNVADFIGRAIASVQAQTVVDWEAIVVDDASVDGTCDVVRASAEADPRIRLIRQDRNQGPAAARNRAIEAAAGDWIAVLDADDAWRPERLERLLAEAAATGADFVADNLIRFDQAAGIEVDHAFHLALERTPLSLDFLLPGGRQNGLMKPIISNEFIKKNHIIYDVSFRSSEDLLLYIDLYFAGAKMIVVKPAYYVYTMRVGPVSGTRSPGSRSTTAADNLVAIAAIVASRHGHAMSAHERRLVRRLRTSSMRLRVFQELTARRRSGRLGSAAMLAAVHPLATMKYFVSSPTWRRLVGN